MTDEIHVNDVGTRLIITIKESGSAVDISSATSLQIVIKSPDTTTSTKNASLYTDGTDGKITYILTSGDVSVSGRYKIQAIVQIDGGTYYSSIYTFKVHCNL